MSTVEINWLIVALLVCFMPGYIVGVWLDTKRRLKKIDEDFEEIRQHFANERKQIHEQLEEARHQHLARLRNSSYNGVRTIGEINRRSPSKTNGDGTG